jgi:prevent-host-death family protein
MKIVAMNEARANFAECLQASQEGRVLITSHGKPVAFLVGVAGQELDGLMWQSDEVEANILAERRKGPFIPWEQAKAELGLTTAPPAKKRKNTNRKTKASSVRPTARRRGRDRT